MDKFIPKSQPKTDKRKKLWMNKAAITLRKKKYNSWKRYRDRGLSELCSCIK
jgi:hypothetical protein